MRGRWRKRSSRRIPSIARSAAGWPGRSTRPNGCCGTTSPFTNGWRSRKRYRPLYPPCRGRLLFHDDAVEETCRLGQSLFRRQQAVLVLDGEHVVVAEHAQRGGELLPPLLAVAVAAGAEDPGAVALVGIRLGIEHAGEGQVAVVDLGVLGVHVEDGVA